MSLAHQSATKLKNLLETRQVSCREVVSAVFSSIREKENDVRAFLTLSPIEDLLAEADRIDEKRASGGQVGKLAGIPIAVKDNISTRGIATTCASRMLKHYVPPYNATVIETVKREDGIILGKTNMDEFAMGSSTENSAFQVTRNPHDLERVPGGTSGGSAAAVAACEAPLAIGSDTGGSIRQPAAFCGVVGVKPTYGRVSRYGLIAYSSSLDQIGTFGKTVSDAAFLLEVIGGFDPKDSTSANKDFPQLTKNDKRGRLRIGLPIEFFESEALDKEIRKAIELAVKMLEDAGHNVVDVSLPSIQYSLSSYYIIAFAEASSNLARFDGCQYGYRSKDAIGMNEMILRSRSESFGDEVKRRLMLGNHILSAGYQDQYYLSAAKVRTVINAEFKNAFGICDALIHPITPTPAFRIGEKSKDPLEMYLADVFSITANLTGLPGISIPCGVSSDGLPLGVQITSPWFEERILFDIAYELEDILAQQCPA